MRNWRRFGVDGVVVESRFVDTSIDGKAVVNRSVKVSESAEGA